jgi:hypothetical protein
MKQNRLTQIAWLTLIFLMVASSLSVWSEVVRDWLPPVDGPYQTANACRRILAGQIPGRDFVVFHGLGLNWYHVPFYALLGGNIQGTVAAYFIAGALVIPITLIFAARLGGFGWRASTIVGLLIINVMLVVPGPSYNAVMPGGNMLGTRIALSLLPVMAALLFMRAKRPIWQVTVAVGSAIGLAMSVSQDQGISLLAGSVMAFFFSKAIRSNWKISLAAGVGALLTCASVYLLLVTLMSAGAPQEYLEFAWKRIPENQFWLFGASSDFFGTWKDLLNKKYVIVPGAVTVMMWLGALIVRRMGRADSADRSMILPWMAWYAVASLHPLLGYLSGHYFASAMYAALVIVAFSVPSFWNAMHGRLPIRLTALIPAAGIAMAIMLCGLEYSKNSLRKVLGKSYLPISAVAYVDEFEFLVAQEDPDGRGLTASRQAEVVKNLIGPEGKVWSILSGQERESLGILPPGRHDYIVYVLGDKAREQWLADFAQADPDWILTTRQSSGGLEQWMNKIYWKWYKEEVALRYEPVMALNQELIWRKRPGNNHAWQSKEVVSQLAMQGDLHSITFQADAESELPQLHEVSFRYRLTGDPIPVVSRRLCRVMVGRDTAHEWKRQSLEVKPGDEWLEAIVPVITRAGENVALTVHSISPAGAPHLEIEGVKVIKLTGCSALTPAVLESDTTAAELYRNQKNRN